MAGSSRSIETILTGLRKWGKRFFVRELVRELEKDGGQSFTADYVTPVMENWKKYLKDYQGRPDLRILEIGSYEGRSALWFLDNVLSHPTAMLVCVDVFLNPFLEARFDHNVRVSGSAIKVTKMKGLSEALIPQLPPESFDLIYVDGGHRTINVLMDGVLAWERLTPGGLIIFDDYLWQLERPLHERPQLGIDLLLTLLAGRYELVMKDYQVILRKHRNPRPIKSHEASLPDAVKGVGQRLERASSYRVT